MRDPEAQTRTNTAMVAEMRKRAPKPRKVVWVACNGDQRRHAHVLGERLCRPLKVMDTAFWLHGGTEQKPQPTHYCQKCEKVLEDAVMEAERSRLRRWTPKPR